MRALLAGLVVVLVLASAAWGVTPTNATGTLTFVGRTATSVTLEFTQTGGDPVKVYVDSYCYQGDVFAGSEKVAVSGHALVTFNTGPRKFRGKVLVPTECWSTAYVWLGSSAVQILAGVETLP
jgi:hypothetical protein